MRNGYRRVAEQADMAVYLVTACGMSVTKALAGCDVSAKYFYALKALRESGHTTLLDQVLRGIRPVLASAKQVENAAVAITAYQKCSALERELFRLATGATADAATLLRNMDPDQLVTTSRSLGLDWIWDNLIAAAMPAAETATEPTA
jgi:hypothetical protein